MTSRREKRGVGCGVVFALALVILSIPILRMGCAVWKTKQTEQALIDTMGKAPAFTPAVSGAVASERVEAFLRVRRHVFEYCAEFQGYFSELNRLDERDEDPAASSTTALKENFGGLKQLLRAGPGFLQFMEARNGALLEERMGLGEYMYIYALAYRRQLQLERHSRFADIEQAYVGGRARRELAQILENQLEALKGDPLASVEEKWADLLRDQVALMHAEEKPLPWEAELPPRIAASFSPFRGSLDSLYCSGLAKMELSQKNKGLDIKN